jgi:hypothetical protein
LDFVFVGLIFDLLLLPYKLVAVYVFFTRSDPIGIKKKASPLARPQIDSVVRRELVSAQLRSSGVAREAQSVADRLATSLLSASRPKPIRLI